jgi:hypothetical protein
MSYSYLFRELQVSLTQQDRVQEALAQALHIRAPEISSLEVERFALDSRKKGNPHWSYNVRFDCAQKLSPVHGLCEASSDKETLASDPFANSVPMPQEVTIVGAGPAGLWATLHLLRRGFKVTLHEQGKPVEARFRDIRHFFADRKFNPHSNILFGEGGAGAFSDGKLNTRSRNAFSEAVLRDMAQAGLPESILTFSKPHIGTNKLVLLLRVLRRWILDSGGTIHFESSLEDIEVQNKVLTRAKFNGVWEPCSALVLAPGHSARDIYTLLHERGVALESKAFAMGVRVEHPQQLINDRQLGKNVDTRITGSAEYTLTAKTLHGTSSAYSFCMCPGGVLVPCASEPATLATNGMSHSHRRGPFANGAIVVPIPKSETLFGGLEWQRQLESTAFQVGGGKYSAPGQTIEAFLQKITDHKPLPDTTYPCGLTPSNLWEWMECSLCESLAEGFSDFDRKIPGFIREGLIVAPETRTSSPLRILRNPETLESVSTQGLFVLGEGAGYAGGIVTSAADGVRLANRARLQKS